jgi:glycosyltransferase involved in cell wall biosynthesis
VAGFDFVHAGGNAAYAAAWLKLCTNAKVIFDVHGDVVSETQLEWSTSPRFQSAYELIQAHVIQAVAARSCDYFLAVSRPLGERLVQYGAAPDRIALIRNGVDLETFSPGACNRNGHFTITYAGGFQRWQGLDSLVQAFERLTDDRVRLRIIGFGPDQESYRRDIRQRLGERVDLVDRLPRDMLVKELRDAQVLALPRPPHPAVTVAMPTKFGEYLALGKPVLVCDVDETAALVREHGCGFVSNPGPAALAESIREIATVSDNALHEAGQRSRQLAEIEFSWQQIGRKYAASLESWARAA